eukprot:2415683-Rhodomonas_salina.3
MQAQVLAPLPPTPVLRNPRCSHGSRVYQVKYGGSRAQGSEGGFLGAWKGLEMMDNAQVTANTVTLNILLHAIRP